MAEWQLKAEKVQRAGAERKMIEDAIAARELAAEGAATDGKLVAERSTAALQLVSVQASIAETMAQVCA